MSPPAKPRAPSGPRAGVSEGASNLAVQLPSSEPAEPEPETPTPTPKPEATETPASPVEPGQEPIAAGDLAYADATSDQQERARTELQDRLSAYLDKARARVIVTDNLHTMLSIKRGQGVLTLRMHHMFIGAPAQVIRAVARYAQTQDRDAAGLLRDYVDANEPLIRRREQPRPVTLDVEGRYHNLQDIFDGLNEEYFDGSIQARITWGPRARRRKSRESIKLGSYTVEDELIRIHPVLDAADVPPFFVAWIVYHEMLHEVHDMPVVDGRRVYHTADFRRAEAQFDRYAEAVMWEKANLYLLLDR